MKLAVVFNSGEPDSSELLTRMLEAQRLRPWHNSVRLHCSKRASLGYVQSSERFAAVSLVRESADGNMLLISGVPISLAGNLDQRLQEIIKLDLQPALTALQQLDGAFAAFLWHSAEQKLGIVTDILGMQPLYVYREDGLLLIATEVKGITATGLVETKMGAAGWGAFLSFGHPIAAQTLLESVHRIPAGAAMIYDPADGELTTNTYWQWPRPRTGVRSLEELPLDDVMEVFSGELRSYHQHNQKAWLCLSGGFDSRLILATLSKLGIAPETFSLSHADEMFDLDAKIAARVARELGAPFTLRHPDKNFFSSPAYLDYIVCKEVATPSLYLFIAQLCAVLEPRMEAIWEGVFPGFILYPPHQPPGGFEFYFKRECASLNSYSWKAADLVFSPGRVSQMREAFTASLAKEKSRYPDDAFGVSQFIVRNRARHRAATNPLQVYCNDVLPFTPGLSKDFLALTGGIPYDLRAGHKLYQYVFQRFVPGAMKVPAVSGSTPYALNSRFDRDVLLGKFGLRMMRHYKLSAVMKRLGVVQGGAFWEQSRLVDAAVREVKAGHHDLNADEVRKLQSAQPPYDRVTSTARELLFYWHSWKGILEGTLQTPAMLKS